MRGLGCSTLMVVGVVLLGSATSFARNPFEDVFQFDHSVLAAKAYRAKAARMAAESKKNSNAPERIKTVSDKNSNRAGNEFEKSGAPNVDQVTTSLTTVAPPEESAWSESAEIRSEYNMVSANNGIGDSDNTTYLRLNYKITSDIVATFGQDIGHTIGTNSAGQSQFSPYDPFLQIRDGNILKLPGDIVFSSALRAYAPLSVASRDKEQMAQFRAYFVVAKDLAKTINLSFTTRPSYYAQTYTTAVNTDGTVSATTNYGWFNSFELNWSITKNLSFYQDLGLLDTWYNGDPTLSNVKNNSAHTSQVVAETAVVYAFTKTFSLSGGLYSDQRDLVNQTSNYALYAQAETSYMLSGKFSF